MSGEESSEANGQRFGYIVDRMPYGSGHGGRQDTYIVRDAETEAHHSFMYADIVTERFRTIRTGERVRFLVDPKAPSAPSRCCARWPVVGTPRPPISTRRSSSTAKPRSSRAAGPSPSPS